MTNLCVVLKQQVSGMLDDIRDIFENEPEKKADVLLVKIFFSNIPPEKLMQHFVAHVLPYEARVKRRDENFFIDNTELWKGLPEGKVRMVSEMWRTGRLSEDDKQMMWEYFDCFIELSKTWRKHK
ncbi:hypothetical protein ISTM_74 [Insectomime virus]|uniref:Uncharacterized protein n=1 Tax=Tunisvirus fontaine2 TaxID=1421067 RepID=V9SGR8_9VIRU|nr:hypothetical protein D1R32_gp250 [Tunisvirus fontaine2]AHA45972.1 hypothetical protein ISTM_74 [Insectomime virus]AHC54967.1 hypothetical protein TNS_ORF249 [Tunisvirus fontaine2]